MSKIKDPVKEVFSSNVLNSLRSVFKNRVKIALLFGSRVHGYSLKGDYDFAIYFGRPYSLLEVGRLVSDIAEVLEASPDKVDLLVLDDAPPSVARDALMGIPIYVSDEYELFDLRFKILVQWLDIAEWTEHRIKELRKKWLGEQNI